MTGYSVSVLALCYVMLSEVEASPRWLHTIHRHPEEYSDVGISSLATHYQRGLSLVGFEEILRYTQNDSVYSVIVSALCHAEQREASPR